MLPFCFLKRFIKEFGYSILTISIANSISIITDKGSKIPSAIKL